MITLGDLSLRAALLFAAWTCITSYTGAALKRRDLVASGARGVYATWILILLASVGIWTALLAHDFSLQYVADVTTANISGIRTLVAFWAGTPGALLGCALALSSYAAIATWITKRHQPTMAPYVTGTVAAITLISLLILCFSHNPYERLIAPLPDGRGLNPALRYPSTALLPVVLALSYASIVVPLAMAIAGAITHQLDTTWATAVDRWLLVTWIGLTIGLTLSMRAAYIEPRSNAGWLSAPIANRSLLPWLVCTALVWTGRRPGARLLAIGLGLFGIGIGLTALGHRQYRTTLRTGATYSATDFYGHHWQFVSNGVSEFDTPGQQITAVAVAPTRDGVELPLIVSEEREYVNTQNDSVAGPVTDPGTQSSVLQSLYVVAQPIDQESAELRIVFTPFVWCTWLGGITMALAGLVRVIPR